MNMEHVLIGMALYTLASVGVIIGVGEYILKKV